MSRGKWVLVVLTLLVTTNVITFGVAYYRFQEEKRSLETTIDQLRGDLLQIQEERKKTLEELRKLKVWEHFINIQHELNAVNEAINHLNYGIAIEQLQKLQESINQGRLGETFDPYREELVGILQQTIDGLKNKEDRARNHLVEFNERLFQILAGISPIQKEEVQPVEQKTGETVPEATENPKSSQPADARDESHTGNETGL